VKAVEHAVILFDLGGVLWDIGGPEPLGRASHGAIGPAEAQRYWAPSAWIRKLDTGRCTAHEFAAGVIAELKLQVDPDEFVRLHADLSRGLMPGAVALLEALRERYVLGCLSNNTELFWTRLCREADLEAIFRRRYLSHEIGLRKPDPPIFEYALADLGVPPHQILYIDDLEVCVDVGLSLGWDAHHARGVGEVRRVLTSLGISPTESVN
jgi:putative hydrolase of the HAD superfamily